MTSKERITIAMKGGTPDRVPVTLGLSEIIPVLKFTNDYIEFFMREKIPLWKARVETEFDYFGSDSFLHLCPEASPHDPECTRNITRENAEEMFYTLTYHTSKGDLSADYYIAKATPASMLKPFVSDLEKDIPKVLEMLKNPETKKLDGMNTAYREIGDRAHAGYWLPTPVEWWGGLRGTQEMVMDLMLYPERMLALFQEYTVYAECLTEHVFKDTPVDSVGLGGSSTSMSVISPELHRKFSLRFGKIISDAAHRYGKPVLYHMCGKSREALPITAEMGVDCFDALECAPTGNVDLSEVKKIFGGKVALRGNVNSIHVMMNGNTNDVRQAVRNCMDAAKEGGGYILGVGDQTPAGTPDENLYAFVEAGRKYGEYET